MGYDALAASLGVKSDQTFFDQKVTIAAGFGHASREASYNASTASKGPAHQAILSVPAASLSRDTNPVDGSSFPMHIRAVDRLKPVSRIGSQVSAPTLYECQKSFWCDICNAKVLLQEAAKAKISWADILSGKFAFTEAMLALIVPIDDCDEGDATFCNCQGSRRKAQPPFSSTILCPAGCGKWIHTPADQLSQGCHKCGFRFGAELPKSAIPDLPSTLSIKSIEDQVDAQRFA